MTMSLTAMPKVVKEDAVTHRVGTANLISPTEKFSSASLPPPSTNHSFGQGSFEATVSTILWLRSKFSRGPLERFPSCRRHVDEYPSPGSAFLPESWPIRGDCMATRAGSTRYRRLST